ncbi:insect cuticle protein domain-containing protein [Phthorimaea operculella]|nr:insect cuticle protein domain-containing protein [Phthorimaea operculella]
MKLLVVLSVVACSYAAKLDRTYLPPASAATAGGSPGSLTAPSGGFGGAAPAGGAGAFQPSGPAGPTGPSGFGKPTGPSGFGQSAGPSGFGQSGANQAGSGAGNYGQAGSGFGQQSAGFNQGGSFNQAQGQGFQQPQRAQAAADQAAEILKYENQNDGETFSYAFETSNGISAEESGVATNGVQAQGAFSYTGDDGQSYSITYTADENGYQPQGDHLPTPPPIPEEILRSIEINAAAAAAGTQEGAYNPDEDNSVTNSGSAFNQAQGGAFNQQSGAGAYNLGGAAQGGAQGPSYQAAGQFNQNKGSAASFNQGAQGSGNNAQGRGPQAQGNNGYEYNRPQGNAQFGAGSQGNRPSQGAAFPRPAAPSGPTGPSQGSFGAQTYNKPAQPSGARPQFNQGPTSTAPASIRPSGSAPSRPQYNKAAQSGSQGASAGFPSQGGFSQAGKMQDSAEGYQYNRPGQQAPRGQARPQGGSQPAFGQAPQQRPSSAGFPAAQGNKGFQGQGQTFEGPKQPASFSEQDGYKY